MSRGRGRRGGGNYGAGQPRPRPAQHPAVEGEIVRGQVMDLGDLSGTPVEPVVASFVYFGERIRVNPDLSETAVMDLFARMGDIELEGDPSLMARAANPATLSEDDRERLGAMAMRNAGATREYVVEHLHPADRDLFWRTAMANRQGVPALMELTYKILELISANPTGGPSASSDGRPDTNPRSADGASPPDGSAAGWWPEGVPRNPIAEQFVDRFESRGRPDLANFVMLAQEARARSSAAV